MDYRWLTGIVLWTVMAGPIFHPLTFIRSGNPTPPQTATLQKAEKPEAAAVPFRE